MARLLRHTALIEFLSIKLTAFGAECL